MHILLPWNVASLPPIMIYIHDLEGPLFLLGGSNLFKVDKARVCYQEVPRVMHACNIKKFHVFFFF